MNREKRDCREVEKHGEIDCREVDKHGGKEIVGRRKNLGDRRLSGGGKTWGKGECREAEKQGKYIVGRWMNRGKSSTAT